jgi:AcrR family transcriptional regulator
MSSARGRPVGSYDVPVRRMAGASGRYSSSLRDEQAAETRQRILGATVEMIADESADGLTIASVARRAGVAVRTVYRYFPTRDDLLRVAGGEFDDRVGFREFAGEIDGLEPQLRDLYGRYAGNEAIVRAALDTRSGRELRARARRDRIQGLERTLEPLLEGLEPEERTMRVALVYLFYSAQTWRLLGDYTDLTSEQVAATSSLGLRTVLAAFERDARRRRKP